MGKVALFPEESFSRSSMLVVADDNGNMQSFENPCEGADVAGPCIVKFLKDKNVTAVGAENVGKRARRLLEEEGIEIYPLMDVIAGKAVDVEGFDKLKGLE